MKVIIVVDKGNRILKYEKIDQLDSEIRKIFKSRALKITSLLMEIEDPEY